LLIWQEYEPGGEKVPMLREALGVFACLAILSLMGIGPALWAISPGEKRRFAYAAGIAPTLGLAIVGLLGFPLIRYFAPVRSWALPFTVLLILASIAIVAYDWRRNRGDYRILADWRSILPTLGFVLVCCVILVSPLIFNGIQYAIFRQNPSDAFVYMSLAETVRVVDWHTLIRGVDLNRSNLEGLKRLAEASPTALFTARFIAKPLQLANPIALGWAAEMVGVPTYRFYYAYHLLCFALALPISLVLGDLLGLSRLLNFLTAGAVVLGFWAKFILERDAGYQISSFPLLLLVALAWIRLEREPQRPISRSRGLLAAALAAVIVFYSVSISVIVIAFVCYYGIGLWQRVRTLVPVWYHGLTALLIVLIFLASGQLDYVVRHLLFAVSAAGGEARFVPHVLGLIRRDGAAALWGLPPSIIFEPFPEIAQRLARLVAQGIGICLTGVLLAVAARMVRKSASVPKRIVFALLAGGFCLAVTFAILGNLRASGKAFTYVYPYLILGVVLYPGDEHGYSRLPLQRPVFVLLNIWLIAQCLLGLYLPYAGNLGGIFHRAQERKAENYDLSAIVKYLENHPPRLLLVNIPRTRDWTFAYYSMFVFGRYPSYFQSGIIVDNSARFQNLWFGSLTEAPDYVVVRKSADYIRRQKLGRKVAQSDDLVLYRVTVKDVTPFVEQERVLREKEAVKPVFPTWKAE